MQTRALEWVDRFHRHLATERRVSPHTASAYRLELAALVAFCDRERIEVWSAVLVSHVRTFAARSHARGLSPPSVARRLSAVRTFMKFLIREGVIQANSAELVQAPRAARRLPSVLDPDQMKRLVEIPATDTNSIRDRAILELLYSSGLRLIELIRLDCGNVDLSNRLVHVLGKGDVERLIPVGSFALTAIQQWLRVRTKVAKAGETALFVGRGGRRLKRRIIQVRVDYWAQRQGIAAHVHPHMLRHAAATHMLESSGDIRAIQEFLGHASISTTQIYTHLDAAHLVTAYAAAHPRARRVTGPPRPLPEPVVIRPKPKPIPKACR